MTLYLSHTSSALAWDALDADTLQLSRSMPSAGDAHAHLAQECSLAREILGLPEPLHIMVASDNQRHRNSSVIFHVYNTALPERSFYRLVPRKTVFAQRIRQLVPSDTPSLYLCSPELTFAQMASVFTWEQLIEYGFMICGTFYLSDNSPHGTKYREPLTNASRLNSYLSRASGLKGLPKARQAAKYVLDNSRSPRESKLAIMLCLPTRLGGFGLPRPILNWRVSTGIETVGAITTPERFGDLCWPKQKLVVEYDSNSAHAAKEKLNADSARRTEIVVNGMNVLSVTDSQVSNFDKLELLVRAIERYLGIRHKQASLDVTMRRAELARMLFGSTFLGVRESRPIDLHEQQGDEQDFVDRFANGDEPC